MDDRRMNQLLLGVSLACGLGCAGGAHSFSGPAYEHPFYSYRIDVEGDGLLPSEWELDNYRRTESGYVEKTRSEYQTLLKVDLDDDGEVDWADDVRLYDLRFRHRRTASVIAIQTVPLSTRNGELDLRILAEMYLEASSGTDRRVYRFDQGVAVSERRYAPRVLRQRAVAVAGRPAWEVVYERVNIEREQVDPNARPQREKVVLVRAGMPFASRHLRGTTIFTLPTVMVFALSAPEHEFEAAERDLQGLIERVSWADSAHPGARGAVLRCSERALVGFIAAGRKVVVPGTDEGEAECIRGAVEGLETGSYSFGRPYEAPPPEAPPASEATVDAPSETRGNPPPDAETADEPEAPEEGASSPDGG